MKIAIINSYVTIPSKGAESIFLMKLCEAYANKGHEVHLYVSNNKPDVEIENFFEFYGVARIFSIKRTPLLPGGFGKFFSLSILTGIRLANGKYDLIHSRSLTPAWFAAKFLNLPVILEMHGKPPQENKQKRIFSSLIKNKNLRFVIAITNSLAEYLRAHHIKGKVVLSAHDGVSKSDISLEDETKKFREELNLTKFSNKYLAVYTGHLYKGRGVELILEISTFLPSYHFLIVGGKEDDVKRYKNIAKNHLNVSFTGFTEPAEIKKYQKVADVLLMPYSNELYVSGGGKKDPIGASPMKMFEYMATGKPIVASTLPILQEVLIHQRNALLIPVDRPDKWKEALIELAENKDLGVRLGLNAKNDVLDYTWEKRVDRILSKYKGINED